MKAFFFGAGASCGTFQTSTTPVPVAAKFGEVLYALRNQWTSEYPELVKVVDHLRLPRNDWGLEPVWTCIDYYSKFKEILGDPPWSAQSVSPQLKKAILEVYGDRCDRAVTGLPLNDNYTLGNLVKREMSGGDVLISSNYDTILERLAARFGRFIRSVNGAKTNSTIILAKPHGSASWRMRVLDRQVESEELPDNGPLFNSMLPADVDAQQEPLLLGAVPIKSELIKEVQDYQGSTPPFTPLSWIHVFNTISAQWMQVARAIREASRIIIVGYSFPKEDHYARFIMRESVRLRTTKPLIVEFFELRNRAAHQAKEIMDAFDAHIDKLIYRGEVEPFP